MTIKTNLNLNIQGLMECEKSALENNLRPPTSLSGIDSSTLKMSAFDLATFIVVLIFG